MRFGQFIRKKRIDDLREITQGRMAEQLGISLTYLSYIEHGRKKPFNADLIETFCAYLGLSDVEKAHIYDLAAKEKKCRSGGYRGCVDV